jgi:hypothetical protein
MALSADEVRHGYILTDVAYPSIDCAVEMGVNEEPVGGSYG